MPDGASTSPDPSSTQDLDDHTASDTTDRPATKTSSETPRKQELSGGQRPSDRRSRPTWQRVSGILAILVLVPVVAVTVLRLIDIPHGLTDTLVSFVPYGVPGALIAGMLAALGRLRLVTAAAAALFVVHVAWIAPMYLSDGPSGRGHITAVMSVNLAYGHGDAGEVVDLVREHEVEILSVQELTPEAEQALRQAGLDRMLPHRYVEPDRGTPNGTGIWSTYPLEPAEFGNEQEMAFENLRAMVTMHGLEVDVLAVHPYSPLPTTSHAWRRDINELVRVGVPNDRPMIMAGDFNATRDHPPMRRLADQGMANAADQAAAGYVPTWGPGGVFPSLFEIDHVLVSEDDVRASDVSRHPIAGSDHKAVIADLRVIDETAGNAIG